MSSLDLLVKVLVVIFIVIVLVWLILHFLPA